MQRAAVQPGNHQRTLDSQRTVDVSRPQADRPGPDGQPRATRVLALDGEQPVDDISNAACGRPGQQLRRQAVREHFWQHPRWVSRIPGW
jgi:hypothetical protein